MELAVLGADVPLRYPEWAILAKGTAAPSLATGRSEGRRRIGGGGRGRGAWAVVGPEGQRSSRKKALALPLDIDDAGW